MQVTKIECKDCRHEDSENLPFSACRVCVNMSMFDPKELAPNHSCSNDDSCLCNGNCINGDSNEQH